MLDSDEIESMLRLFNEPRSAVCNHIGTHIPKWDRKLNLLELFLSFGGVHRKSSQYQSGEGGRKRVQEVEAHGRERRSITIIMENDRDRSGTWSNDYAQEAMPHYFDFQATNQRP